MKMFRKLLGQQKKKQYTIKCRVYAGQKPIAEFLVKSHGHTKKQATELAEEKLSVKVVKAYLIREK